MDFSKAKSQTEKSLSQLKACPLSDYGKFIFEIKNLKHEITEERIKRGNNFPKFEILFFSNKSGREMDKWEIFEHGNKTIADVREGTKFKMVIAEMSDRIFIDEIY